MAKSWRSKGDIAPAVALALLLLFWCLWILLWNNVEKFYLVEFVPFACVPNEFPSCEYWVKKVRIFHKKVTKIRVSEIRVSKISVSEIRVSEIRVREFRVSEIRWAKSEFPQITASSMEGFFFRDLMFRITSMPLWPCTWTGDDHIRSLRWMNLWTTRIVLLCTRCPTKQFSLYACGKPAKHIWLLACASVDLFTSVPKSRTSYLDCILKYGMWFSRNSELYERKKLHVSSWSWKPRSCKKYFCVLNLNSDIPSPVSSLRHGG